MTARTRRLRRPFPVVIAALLVGCASGPTGPPATTIARFDSFWATFDAQYSYFAYKNVDWDSLRAEFRPRAAAATTQNDLVTLLSEMVAPLRDVHVGFTTPAGQYRPTYVSDAPGNWLSALWQQTIQACAWQQVKSDLGYCLFDTVAYVAIGSWTTGRFTVADLDRVIDDNRDATAIVIDVRPNRGGDDQLAFALAGRFTATTITSGYVRFRNGPLHSDFGPEIARTISPRGSFQYSHPVVVLTGRGVLSSTESFIAAMRELPNVTIVGDTTGGGSGNPGSHPLGDGWTYTVSRWMEWTADRSVIEWQGIPPDVYVPWDEAQVNAGRDPVFEAGLARAREAAAAAR